MFLFTYVSVYHIIHLRRTQVALREPCEFSALFLVPLVQNVLAYRHFILHGLESHPLTPLLWALPIFWEIEGPIRICPLLRPSAGSRRILRIAFSSLSYFGILTVGCLA